MEKLEFNGKVYPLMSNFPKGYTIDQNKVGKPLFLEFVINLKFKLDDKGLPILDMTEYEMFEAFKKWEYDAELLALMYLNEGEAIFKLETYYDRVKEFGEMPLELLESVGDEIRGFFPFVMKSALKSSLTFLVQPTAEKPSQPQA